MENAIRELEDCCKNIKQRTEDIETKIIQVQTFKNCNSTSIKALLDQSETLQENHNNLSSSFEEVNKAIKRNKNLLLLNAIKNCQTQVHALSQLSTTIKSP